SSPPLEQRAGERIPRNDLSRLAPMNCRRRRKETLLDPRLGVRRFVQSLLTSSPTRFMERRPFRTSAHRRVVVFILVHGKRRRSFNCSFSLAELSCRGASLRRLSPCRPRIHWHPSSWRLPLFGCRLRSAKTSLD